MQKLDGHICDCCRTLFRPSDHIVEMCEDCANTVYCVMNIYESGKEELSSIHHTEEKAQQWIETGKELLAKFRDDFPDKIIEQKIVSWFVL